MTEQINDERVQAVVERIARAWADEGVKDCAVSPEGRARMWPDIYGMTARSTARVLAALKAGDVLPGDGSGRLVVVREGDLQSIAVQVEAINQTAWRHANETRGSVQLVKALAIRCVSIDADPLKAMNATTKEPPHD